jgi:hypothetical protein
MTIGPLLMVGGLAWLARIPADSSAWQLAIGEPATWLPSTGYLADVLPAQLVYGFGISIMVAPLTTALMRSVPARQAGLASAINNALSRVGPQLAGALVFVVVTASFYGVLAERVPSLDVGSAIVREQIPPLRQPSGELPAEQLSAAREASTEAFHLAMLVAALMVAAGAAVNWFGISDRQARAGPDEPALPLEAPRLG